MESMMATYDLNELISRVRAITDGDNERVLSAARKLEDDLYNQAGGTLILTLAKLKAKRPKDDEAVRDASRSMPAEDPYYDDGKGEEAIATLH